MKSNSQKKLSNKTLRLTETAIFIAVAFVLSLIPVINLPRGGSVTVFSQLPIIMLAFRYGTPWGLLSGVVYGLLQMMTGLANFSYVTGIGSILVVALCDYLVAFGALGLGGVFKGKIKSQSLALACGATVASLLRLICHIISGSTVWKGYAGSDAWGAIIKFSIVYNSSYMIPELIVTVIGAVALSKVFDFTSENITLTKKKSK
ncbi:MAG: energy-coupled thiamine transporter ThiT [Oscillospiraceae bacterium]